jgi:hypothetical protein
MSILRPSSSIYNDSAKVQAVLASNALHPDLFDTVILVLGQQDILYDNWNNSGNW